jgi:hypothetical protein
VEMVATPWAKISKLDESTSFVHSAKSPFCNNHLLLSPRASIVDFDHRRPELLALRTHLVMPTYCFGESRLL